MSESLNVSIMYEVLTRGGYMVGSSSDREIAERWARDYESTRNVKCEVVLRKQKGESKC